MSDTITVNITEAKDAYQIAVAGGFEGTREEWLENLVGPIGPVDPTLGAAIAAEATARQNAITAEATARQNADTLKADTDGSNVQAKAKEWSYAIRAPHFNVRNFGVTGDGSTDDRVKLQEMVDALGGVGSAVLYFPNGIYRLTKKPGTGYCVLCPYHGLTFMGDGMGSRLACDDASATTLLFAKVEGPYDANTEWVDGCRVTNLYFNPLVQKSDDALEIRIPYSRDFVGSGLKFGRYQGLVSFIDDDIPSDEESKIGTFLYAGDVFAPPSSHIAFQNIRGFGFYRAVKATNCANFRMEYWGTDANRDDAQSIHFFGALEVPIISDSGFVNSFGVNGSSQPCLLIEGANGRVPRWGMVTNTDLDSHKYAVDASAGYGWHLTNVWMSGKNGPGARLRETADEFFFSLGHSNDNQQEAFSFLAGNHTVRDWECVGVAQVIADTATKARIFVGPNSGVITLDNVRCRTSDGTGIAASAALASLHIAAGPKRVNIIGGEYLEGIYDLSGINNDISLASVEYWLKSQCVTPAIDSRLTTRWPNAILSRNIGRSPGDAFRPAFRSNVDGIPAMEFGKGGRTFNCLRLYDELASAENPLNLGNCTIHALVKVTGDAAILGRSNNNWNFRISSAGIMSIRFAGAGTTVSSAVPLTTAMGEWVLVSWRRTGDTIEFIENGAVIDTQTGASTEGMLIDQIGGFNGQEPPHGYLADIFIRSASESDPSLATTTLVIMNQYPSVFSV